MKRGSYTAGAIFASLAAGPAFLASLALAVWAAAPTVTYTAAAVDFNEIGGTTGGLLASVLFGFVFAIIPNLVGAWFMQGLGIGNFAARLPVAWALAGAGAADLPFALVGDLGEMGRPLPMAFALTGASCALVAHRFARWT